MKNPARLLASLLPLALVLGLATGCAPKEPSKPRVDSQEQKLTEQVSELREKLADAERDLQQTRSNASASTSSANESAPTTANNAGNKATDTDEKAEDTSYIVVKKTFVPGQLIPVPTGAAPNATERRAADCRITFKGEQSGRIYPELLVQEIAYASFREGGSYTAQELIQAKRVADTNVATANGGSSTGATTTTPAAPSFNAGSIFEN